MHYCYKHKTSDTQQHKQSKSCIEVTQPSLTTNVLVGFDIQFLLLGKCTCLYCIHCSMRNLPSFDYFSSRYSKLQCC